MNSVFILVMGVAGLWAVGTRGAKWTFLHLYLPVLVLVPHDIGIKIQGMPELNSQAVLTLALYAGILLGRRERLFAFPWRAFDLLALVPVVTFSISYGLEKGLDGFLNRVPLLTFTWACPYLLTRALIRDREDLVSMLRVLAVSAAVLAALAAYECRMAVRLTTHLWTLAGFDVEAEPHFGGYRWGFLRACASFTHAIYLGTFFAATAPLMVLWTLLDPRSRTWAKAAVVACLAGGVASLSRGPILTMAVATLLPLLLGWSRRTLLFVVAIAGLLLAPIATEWVDEERRFVQRQMETTGNTSSGHYRFALFMIYGKQLGATGWFGNTAIITGREYTKVWSVDNAYLLLFITGGWLGGGAICAIIVSRIYQGLRFLYRLERDPRRRHAPILAAFVAMACCMLNVWFTAEYAWLFWVCAALITNFMSREEPRCI